MTQIFNIHDNGDVPFKVEINENQVDIFSTHGTTPILKRNAKKIFIGKSPKNKMTTFSAAHGPDFLGNSLLLQLEDNQYEFIGRTIFTFSSLAEIVEFVSPVGNSDVPYPYAIDADGNTYLMIEHVVLKGAHLFEDDPYSYYYDKSTMGEFYMDETIYVLNYCAFPEKNYERMTRDLGKQMFIMSTNNTKTLISKEAYVCLIQNYGHSISVEPFLNMVKHI
jgi:hypothetical protein